MLNDVDLDGANLAGAELVGSNLSDSKLANVRLRACDMTGANLGNAELVDCNLDRVNLANANLAGANLQSSSLKMASLQGADLDTADLRETNLNRSTLTGAYLFKARLSGSHLNGALLDEAILSQVDLRRASCVETSFRDAHLERARLENANLTRSEFTGANLRGADCHNARLGDARFDQSGFEADESHQSAAETTNLTDAVFKHADLKNARMVTVTGLRAHQLAGCDLTNARLPEDISSFDGLNFVENLSKHGRSIFLVLIATCVFCWLTIATTSDAALISSATTTPLPIIQSDIPTLAFYWVAPVLLLILFVYLHLYLQSLWEGLGGLPAVFPDGRSVDHRAYPWLLTSYSPLFIPLLRDRIPTFARTRLVLSVIAAWGFVPLTMALFGFAICQDTIFWGRV